MQIERTTTSSRPVIALVGRREADKGLGRRERETTYRRRRNLELLCPERQEETYAISMEIVKGGDSRQDGKLTPSLIGEREANATKSKFAGRLNG